LTGILADFEYYQQWAFVLFTRILMRQLHYHNWYCYSC